jgi:hypothetical protein
MRKYGRVELRNITGCDTIEIGSQWTVQELQAEHTVDFTCLHLISLLCVIWYLKRFENRCVVRR